MVERSLYVLSGLDCTLTVAGMSLTRTEDTSRLHAIRRQVALEVLVNFGSVKIMIDDGEVSCSRHLDD